MRPSSFFSGGASVACELSCGLGVIFRARVRAAFRRSAARPLRRGARQVRGAVSSGPISISCFSSIGPVSRPASICMVVRPVRVSPLTMAQLIGRRAAIFRQQRTVQVDPAEARNVDEPRGNNLAVGDDDHRVGRDAAEIFVAPLRI